MQVAGVSPHGPYYGDLPLVAGVRFNVLILVLNKILENLLIVLSIDDRFIYSLNINICISLWAGRLYSYIDCWFGQQLISCVQLQLYGKFNYRYDL